MMYPSRLKDNINIHSAVFRSYATGKSHGKLKLPRIPALMFKH